MTRKTYFGAKSYNLKAKAKVRVPHGNTLEQAW